MERDKLGSVLSALSESDKMKIYSEGTAHEEDGREHKLLFNSSYRSERCNSIHVITFHLPINPPLLLIIKVKNSHHTIERRHNEQ